MTQKSQILSRVQELQDRGLSRKAACRKLGVPESTVRGWNDDRLSPMLIVPDVHAPFHDVHAWNLMMDVARDLKPETVVVIGDFIDCAAVSTHSKDPARKSSLKEEVSVAKELRAELEDLDAKTYVFCEGNHCDRLRRYLWDKAPELYGLVDIPTLLGLDDRWEFVPYRNHTKRGAVHYTHDVGHAGRYAAYQTLDTYQHSVVTGHTHRLSYVVEGNAVGDAKLSAQFGWLGDVEQVDYMHRAKARKFWALGFGIGYEDRQTGHNFLTPVPIVSYRAVVNGKLYKAPTLRSKRT